MLFPGWKLLGFGFFLTAAGSLLQGGEKPQPPRFRADVELVTVPVAVTDPLNRYVVGLEKEHFTIFENRVEQEILHFSNDESPISVGIILDTSGSMADNILSARNSVTRFLERSNPEDEYFLITFNTRSTLIRDFTNRGENIENETALANPQGGTALFDAIYLGLNKIGGARNPKKALLIITDGEDNASRYTFSEVKELAKESDVQIYVIGERGELGYGMLLINDIVRLSGGRAFFPSHFKELDYLVDLIQVELRNQYLVGYRPTNQSHDGQWRKIKVRLTPPEGSPRLAVRAKEGYRAPAN